MQRRALALALLVGGCRFNLHAIDDVSPSVSVDLATAAAVPDLSAGIGVADDLATAPALDLASDPCANPPALGGGNLAAQCVIGNPPTVDGNLADWPPLAQWTSARRASAALSGGSWQNDPSQDDPDCSAKFFVRWDLSYLYVAVSVTDDIRNVPNSPPGLTDNDAVELFFDGLHDRSQAYGDDDRQLVYSADKAKMAAKDGNAASWPAGTVEKWGGTSPAWTLEAAVPWSALGGTPATLGRVVGFDVKLDDNDGGFTRARDLAEYYAAPSGGACSAPYCRTDAFGAVQLHGR